ncbi:MAG TPA: CRTAC1 family protein [Candidatus Binatia bacterium]|nr:CRTAC1 family protein [Candidatus Binatia bacterium]
MLRFPSWVCGSLLLPFTFVALAAIPDAAPIFREVPAQESGVTWIHHNGFSPNHYLPESTGPGVAIFDYNNDGLMDILLVDSGTSVFYKPDVALHPVLYRNNGNGTFTDVSKEAGLTADLYGQGVAVGDYDGDGYEDVFISGYGKCVLYHNNGNGTFTDVTASSGIKPTQWGSSALWFDYDNDGKLDLFVGEFVDYSSLRVCSASESYGGESASTQSAYYCNPKIFKPTPSELYRNLGNGKFTDVSETTGIGSKPGKAWGVVGTDINNDGFMDLFVSNDIMPNYLWMNRDGKKFEEVGVEAGVGYSSEGAPRSGMGVDAGDFDQDGLQDLVVGNIDTQTHSLYHNIGGEMFDDVNLKTGVSQATRMMSGWGLRFFDYDNDGWPDLILSNGHPDDAVETRNAGIGYRQPIVLMHNNAGAKMENVSAKAGTAFSKKYSSRGLAVGDLNNDGYPDVVFAENGGPVHILMNTASSGNNWLGLVLRPKTTNPDAVGAVIRWSVGGKVRSLIKTAGGSFLSSHDPRRILGAGKSQIEWVEIAWPRPSRRVDRISKPAMNRYMTVVEGQGATASK